MQRTKDYSIGDTARLRGITPKQLRNWEQRGFILGGERVVCGERAYRRFGIPQIEQIKRIKEHLEAGFTLQAAAKKVKEGI